jgi:superfamily I DNA/RNA helicase
MEHPWSVNQQNIFSFIERGQGNAIIVAVAGSGKSTTIVEGMNRVPNTLSTIFLAFNKTIADELKGRGVNARTFHSLTYSPVLKARNARQVDADKLRKIFDAEFSGNERRLYGSFSQRLVGLARQIGVGCLVPDNDQVWMDMVILHDLEIESDEGDLGTGIEIARKLLDFSNASNMVDFDDLLYLAVKDGISLPKFAFVFVDEAQDTNPIQRAILRKILNPRSRLVAVGDPAQAIYGFRGADSNSLNMIQREFNCISLPLTVSYRCPTSVVEYAHQWVGHIEAAPDAPEGIVRHMDNKWKVTDFVTGDLVVCRTTRPLIALGYKMLQAKVPVCILGREIGQGLVKLVTRMKANSIDELLQNLAAWEAKEMEKAVAKMDDAKADRIGDQCSAIRCIADGMDDGEHTVQDLIKVIEDLFNAPGAATVLSTIHKAKGLEAHRVYWLNRSQCPSKWARQPWQQQQEANLCYVATTRAKRELVMIEDGE